MSKAEMMLSLQPIHARAPKPASEAISPESTVDHEPSRVPRGHRRSRAPWGPLLRVVRQRDVAGPRTWRPWWLLGLVEVVTFPLPRFTSGPALYVPGIAASCGLPARPALLVAL